MAEITNGQRQYDALNERYGCKVKCVREFFRKAHILEEYGSHIAREICNNPNFDGEYARESFECGFDKFLKDNFKNYNKAKSEFFLNWDPRGYCVKIEADDIPKTNVYMDWGRNGILIPADIRIDRILYRNSNKMRSDGSYVWI